MADDALGLLSIDEAAKYLKVSASMVRFLRWKSRLAAEFFPGTGRGQRAMGFRKEELDRYLADKVKAKEERVAAREADRIEKKRLKNMSRDLTLRAGEGNVMTGGDSITVVFMEGHTFQACHRFLGGRRRVPVSDFVRWVKNNYR